MIETNGDARNIASLTRNSTSQVRLHPLMQVLILQAMKATVTLLILHEQQPRQILLEVEFERRRRKAFQAPDTIPRRRKSW